MVDKNLKGTELSTGSYTVEKWKAHLWADATRNRNDAFRYDEDAQTIGEDGQLVPHSMCQHIVFEATGGIDKTMSYISDDWTSGAPLKVGITLEIEGHISEVVKKEGSSGPLTIVTFAYTVTDQDGEHIYDLEADLVLMEGL